MEKIKISEDIWKEIENIAKEMDDARVGLNHFSEILKTRQKVLWETIRNALPETKNWVMRLNQDTKEIVRLYDKD